MASHQLPRRLAQLFGVPAVTGIDRVRIEALVGAVESDDLEAKEAMYGTGDSDKRELAADIAAFANARGGLLIIGAAEVKDVVDRLTPIQTAGLELRVHQVVAALVTPAVDIVTHAVPKADNPEEGYLLVLVPPSPRAPHAVANNRDLRFVVRDGPGKRPMGESEVADRYRSRFVDATSRLDRLHAVQDAVTLHIPPETTSAWLVMSALPQVPGYGKSSRADLAATREWLPLVAGQTPLAERLRQLENIVTPGFRRYICGDWALRDQGLASRAAAEIHHDGAGAVALEVGWDWAGRKEKPERLTIGDEAMSFSTLSALHLLAAHAERRGCGGQFDVAATIVSTLPVHLGHPRGHIADRYPGTRELSRFERLTHTLAIEDLATAGTDQVAAAYLVVSELLSIFGLPEALQMTVDGSLDANYISHGIRGTVFPWADRWGVEVLNR